MNKIYKVIWSDVRKCYVVVAEIARNRGKNNVRTIVEGLAAHSLARAGRWALPFVTAGILLQPVSAWATNINAASGSGTVVRNANGSSVYNIYAPDQAIVAGDHTVLRNHFTNFDLSQGNIANLHFRNESGSLKANNLVNLVDNRININGIVNAIRENRIDGNLFFVSPNGMTVGNTGVINAGRLVALAPTQSYYDKLTSNERDFGNAFKDDLMQFGTRNTEGEHKGELKSTNLEFNSGSASTEGIQIAGQINTRSGIVLGAGNIDIKNSAVLQAKSNIAFTDLVNTTTAEGQSVKAFTDADSMVLTAVEAEGGDIILRAETSHAFENSPIVLDSVLEHGLSNVSEYVDSLANINSGASVDVAGSIDGDKGVDISASSKTTFTNKSWTGISGIQDLLKETLSDLGLNIAADFAVKHNTASVAVKEDGSVRAGGNANLQADATVSIAMQAATASKKDPAVQPGGGNPGQPQATSATPVFSVGLIHVKNKAVVDVQGALHSDGAMNLAAKAKTKADVAAKSTTLANDGEHGNSIYLAGAFVFGDSVAEVNVGAPVSGKESQTQKITAGKDFSAYAAVNSSIAVEAVSNGLNDTFVSTAVGVLDYDSAANVNLKRSVEAQNVSAKADNKVESLGISVDNSNGEGADPLVEFKVAGDTNIGVLSQAIKKKLGGGIRQGGKLQGLENAFDTALEYVSVGAGVAVVDNINTANVTIAPGVSLKATGTDAAKDNVTVSANTNMDSFSHAVAGQMNKPQGQSKVGVGAAVLVSNIKNDATVELQSDTSGSNPKGVTLEAAKGSIHLTAEVDSDDDSFISTLRGNSIGEAWEGLIDAFKNFKDEAKKLSDWRGDSIKIQNDLKDGKITTEEAATRWSGLASAVGRFFANEGKNILKADNNAKKLAGALSDYLSPASYTNYYVRSYTVDGKADYNGETDIAASVNYATLENKGIVSIGQKASLTAGKDLTIRADAETDVISATGNGGEYLAYSETNGNGIGASIAWQDISADSIILTGKNVTMKAGHVPGDTAAAGNVEITSNTSVENISINYSGGKADRSGLSGSLNVQDGNSNSLILVDDESTLEAANDVKLRADNKLNAVNVVGGLALGSAKSSATAGAGVALNLFDVNSMAVIGDNGLEGTTIANQALLDPEADDNTSAEEKNKIKAKNTLAAARKLAADRATIRRMGTDYESSTSKAYAALGVKTADDAEKGAVTGKNISVEAHNTGTINAVAVEGVSNSENHKGFDAVNKWNKTVNQGKNDVTDSIKNVIGWPVAKLNKVFAKNETKFKFKGYQPLAENNDAANQSFNAAVAGSVSVNWNYTEVASVIDRVNLNLKDEGTGILKNEATDDVFTGAWAGAGAMNWFAGGAGVASNNAAHKGSLGAAVALNLMDTVKDTEDGRTVRKAGKNVNAVISNAVISQAKGIQNTAIRMGTEVAAGLGIAVTNDSQGTGTNASGTFGLSMNKVDSQVHALLIDNTATNTGSSGTAISSRAYDGDIQVAGGMDFAFANSADGGRAIAAGITAAVSEINNDIQSGIQGGAYTGVNTITVAADDALTQVNAAVGLGFTTSENGFAGAGTLAYAELKNTNHAYISGTKDIKATGAVSVTDRDISGSSANNPYVKYLKDRKVDATGSSYLSSDTKEKLGTEAGSSIVNVAVEVSGSKSVGLGAAVAVANITNKFSSDITNNKNLEADSVQATADVHTNIVSVAAGVSVSTKSFGGTGSLSFNDLDQDNIVSITGNRKGTVNTETNGEAETEGITANTVSGMAKNTSHIVNVTGDFAGGKNAVGLGIAYNSMDDTTGVYAANNQIQAKNATNAVGVSLDADNDAYALALSVGAAATYKENTVVAAHGNFAVNRGHNDTIAVIGEDFGGHHWEENPGQNSGNWTTKDKITNASSVTVKATDKTSRTTIAGSGELSIKPATVALGVGVALTESDKGTATGDGKETVRAEINYAEITTVQKDSKAATITAATRDESKATTVAAGIGLARNAKFSAQGIGADANIFKNNTAGLNDTTIDAGDSSKEAMVTVKADTTSTLKTGAAALQLSGPDSFLAGVVSVGVNRIKDTTTAALTYTDKQNETSMNLGNLDISATSKSDIISVAMGASAAVKGMVTVGGSGSHNYIENNAIAKIEKAFINSKGNVGVVAQSDEAISNYAGIVDVTAGGTSISAAVGVTGSNNQITGKTQALIENSTVNAAGSSGREDDDKVIKTKSKLKENSSNEKYMIEGSVNRGTWSSGSFEEGEGDNKQYGVSRLQKGREEEKKTGVVVDASATHSISSAMANGGVAVGTGNEAVGGSLAGVVNLNYVSGATIAQVLDSNLNNADSRSDVNVHAADYTNVAEFSGSASVAVGQKLSGAAGFTGTTNEVDRVTSAGVSTKPEDGQQNITATEKTKNNIYAKNFNVTADAKQAMSAFNVTGAVAGSTTAAFETGDNVNTNKMHSSTIAMVTNSTVDYTQNAKIKASHEDAIYNMNVDAGLAIAASTNGVAGSLNVGIGVVNEDSVVLADIENSKLTLHNRAEGDTSKSDLSIGAANKTRLEATLVSAGVAAGLFSGGVASSIAVNNIDTNVTSRILGSELTADTINVNTTNDLTVKDATGTGGGGLLAGIGVGVDVNTFNDSVSTIVDHTGEGSTENKSTLKANDTLSVNTKTQRDIDSTVAGVGIGAAGISVNVLAVTVNEGIDQLGNAQDADGNNTSFSHSGVINQVLDTVNDDTKRILSDHFYGLTKTEQDEMQSKVNTSARTGNNTNGTGVHSYVRNNSTLEATNGALTVKNTELNDADLNGGSGSLGIAAVNVADVVYHLNELNDISVQNSTVKGGSVSLTAHQGNVTKSDDEAIHLQTVQAGLGGLAIGVGYAGLTTKGNTGITIDQGTLTATNGNLTIKSSDDAKSKTDMIGVSAGVVSVPISVAHNTNIANNFVTIKGGSVLTALNDNTQTVNDSTGNPVTEKVPAYIDLQTERAGRVAAKTVGVGVGGAAVIVNTAKVYDRCTSTITVEEGGESTSGANNNTNNDTNNTHTAANTFTSDAIRLEAVNAPVVKAEAGGTGVSALGVAVMQSNAEAYSKANVTIQDNNTLQGGLVLARAVIGKEGTDMTHAETHGTNFSLIANVSPNKAKAITETEAKVSMGKETYKSVQEEVKVIDENGQEQTETVTKAATNLALITENNASRRAIIGNTSISLGFSIGTGDAKAVGDDKSIVEAKGGDVGTNADNNAAVKLKNLKISAGGSNTAKGLADGDSGGFTAWGAAATITMNTKTTNTASLSGAWDVTGNADIGALQQVTSKGTSKTGAGGYWSVTWANSDNNVEMDTRTQFMAGAQLNAGQSYTLAANKVVTGAYDDETWNNFMGVGGVIQIAPDIKSRQEIKTNANVEIGKAASGNSSSNDSVTKVTTSKGQVYDAYSDMDIYNKVEGKGGGLAENIYTYSDAFVTSTNKITVNEKAELEQKGEYENGNDITLSSSDKIKMNLAAEAYAGGLEGTVRALVDAPVTRNNGVEVNGKLSSTHDTNIYAGVNADGTKSSLDITALAEAHNNSVIPPYTSPAIELNLKNNQQVKVGTTGSATSVRNINVSAENGKETIKKDTVAVYWLFLGQDKDSSTAANTPGKSTVAETNNNFVNVDGLLKTGIQNDVKIVIAGHRTPSVTDSQEKPITFSPSDNLTVTVTSKNNENKLVSEGEIVVGDMDYATQLGTQLAAIERLIQDYSTGQSGDLVSYLGYLQQKQRILAEMESRKLFKEENGQKVYHSAGYTISYVEIPEISVSGGSIIVQSDMLYGNGRLEANGKPQVTIENKSDAYLKVKGVRVGEDGGEIRFKGESVASNAEITTLNKNKTEATFGNLKNETSTGNVSAIRITSENLVSNNNQIELQELDAEGNPAKDAQGNVKPNVTYTAIPDIAIIGDISNSHGNVIIENKSYRGNINIGSGTPGRGVTVNGKMVQMIASTGSVSQDYVDGIVSIGGRPEDLNGTVVNTEKAAAETDLRSKTHIDNDFDKNWSGSKTTGLTNTLSAPSAGRIAGDSIYIAAADINVNGLIQSGYSRYIAEIDEYVKDEAGNYVLDSDNNRVKSLSDKHIQMLKNNGSEVTVQGRTMYKVNDGRKAVYNDTLDSYEYIVQVYYDPQTKGLVVEDIDASGGKIYLTGRISSTGNGRVLAMDGGAEIAITNAASGDLTTGKILNNNIEGKVTITDLINNTWTEYTRSAIKSMSIADYTSSLSNPDAQVQITTTEIAENERYAANGGKKTTQYIVNNIVNENGEKQDLRYNWTIGMETGTTTYYEKVTNSLFWGGVDIGSDTDKLGTYETQSDTHSRPVDGGDTGRPLNSGNFIGYIEDISGNTATDVSGSDFGLIYENKHTNSTRTVTGNWKESGNWWALWSNPSYHTTWTTKNGSTQSYTFSLKADRPIDVGFIGKKDGSISVANTNTVAGNINLDGDIRNNTKDATLTIQSAGGSIVQKSGTGLTTGRADLRAKNNIENIHIASIGERIDTGTQDTEGQEIYTTKDGITLSAVSYNGGNIDVDVAGGSVEGQKLPGNVIITKLASKGRQDATGTPGNVSLIAEGNITQIAEELVTVEGRGISLTSVNGGIGTFVEDGTTDHPVPRQAVIINSFAEANGVSEDTSAVNAKAKSHIYLTEKEGDMRVGSVISRNGDVRLEATDGRLIDALPQKNSVNNVDENDLIHHWIDAGLIAGTEDYEGAYIKGLKQDAANYKARVEEQYEAFKQGGREVSLRQKFTKPGSSEPYKKVEDYLKQDQTYMVMENSNADYKAHIEYEFNHQEDNTDWQAKYSQFETADDYLAQDVVYENMLASSANYKDRIEKEFALFTVEDNIRTKFTKEDGTYYTSAGEYLNYDTGNEATVYRQLVKDTQNRTNAYVRQINQEFTDYKNGTASAEIAQKFAGFDTVSQYLLADKSSGGYLEMIAEQNQTEVRICEEFSHFTNNTSKGHLTDMFTMPSGKTYDSAAAYLRDDATYNAMVRKYEHPEYTWTKDQLLYAIRNAIVNKDSGVNAESQAKEANVQGQNVTLVARGIGVNTNKITEIKVSELGGGTEASIAKMKQLADADATDVTMKNRNGDILRLETTKSADGTLVNTWKAFKADDPLVEVPYTDASNYEIDKFVIGNLSPLGVYATGKVDVTGISDNVFIAGRSSTSSGEDGAAFSKVRVGQITAVDKDVRLYTQKGIYNDADQLGENDGNIHAKNLIAYGGTEDIGTQDKPLTVSLSGDLLTANANKNVYIKNAKAGDLLRVGSVYAGDTVHLESNAGFAMTENKDYKLGYLNAGKQLDLITNPTTGVIGTALDPIRILNNMGTPEQYADPTANKGMLINLTAKDAYVEGVNGTRGDNTTMRLGLVELAGDLVAHSKSYLEAGAIRLADTGHEGINGSTRATGNVELGAEKDVVVNGPVVSRDGIITVSAGTEARINDKNTGVYANAGNVLIKAGTDARISGKVIARTGDISIQAENFAHVKEGALVEAGTNDKTVAISGKEGITLNSTVKSGNPVAGNESAVAEGALPVYEGGGAILLTSENGSVVQEDKGVLTSASVTVTSGNAIVLENEQSLFRTFTANGVERVKTDAAGNEITDEGGNPVTETRIDGSVLVKVHAGSNLDASVTHTVYGNVTLKNMDAGSLTVLSDVTAKEGKNGETGSIVFKQQGDILVKGALQADGYVTEEGYEETEQGIVGAGTITNERDIQAGKDVTLRTTSGDIHTLGTITAAENVIAASTASTDGKVQISGDVFATNITVASLGATIITEKYMDASQDVTVKTLIGDIDLKGSVHAGQNIGISSGINDLGGNNDASGNISITGSLSATNNLTVQTGYTGNNPNKGNIWLGELANEQGMVTNHNVVQADTITLSTQNGSIASFTGVQVIAGGLVQAETNSGDIGFMGDVSTGGSVDSKVRTKGNIFHNNVNATNNAPGTVNNISAFTSDGTIEFAGRVEAGNGISAITNNGSVTFGKTTNPYNSEMTVVAGGTIKAVSKQGNITFEGTASAGGVIDVTATGGSVRLNNDITAVLDIMGTAVNGDIVVKNGADVKSGSRIEGGPNKSGTIRFTAVQDDPEGSVGNIWINGTIDSELDTVLSAKNGDITVSGDISAGGDVNAKILDKTDGNIILDSNIKAGNELFVETTGGYILMGGVQKTITAGPTVQVKSESGNVSLIGNVIAGLNLNVTTGGTGNLNIAYVGENNQLVPAQVSAGHNVDLTTKDGEINVLGKLEATAYDVTLTSVGGKISVTGDLDAGTYITANTVTGDIDAKGDVTAKYNNVSLTSKSGNIYMTGDIDAGYDVIAETGRNGIIFLNGYREGNILTGDEVWNGNSANNNVFAGHSVNLITENTGVLVTGKVKANKGDVNAVTKTGAIIFVGDVEAGTDIRGTATQNGQIWYDGTTKAGQDVIASTVQGDILYDKTVTAGRNVTASTDKGQISYNASVVAGDSVLAVVTEGDIKVGDTITTVTGDATLTTGNGTITVGEADGTGRINAGGNVTINATKESAADTNLVDILTSVESRNANVNVKTVNGSIHIGSNGANTETVTAKQNVKLEAENGKIIIDGKTSTHVGDITMQATNASYVSGDTGKNIIINHSGVVESARNVNLITVNGDLHVTDNVTAQGTLNAETRKSEDQKILNPEAKSGDISLDQNVTVVKDMTMQAEKGDITVGRNITAENGNVTVNAKSGSVAVGTIDSNGNKSGKIEAGGNVTINAAQPSASDVNIVDIVTSVKSKNADVNVKTVNGNLHIGSNGPNTETVTAKNNVNLEAVEGKIIIDGKTSTKDGNITLKTSSENYTEGTAGQNIIINNDGITHNGVVESGNDANLITVNGDLLVTDNVKARGSVNAQTQGRGDISLGKDVDVENDMELRTDNGSITVGKNITANQGNVTLTTGTGSITVGVDDGNGQKAGIINASGNVNINAGNGNVNIETSVESKAADVKVNVADGNIHIGNNDSDTDTVTAKQNVSLEVANGKITVDGKTSTKEGDITLKATNTEYVLGENGQNIIINQSGVVDSGGNANLIAVNGDLHVTDNVSAKNTLYARTETQGDILFDENVNVVNNMSMQTENGDIVVGKNVTATQGNVSMQTKTGDVIVGSNGEGSVTAGKDVAVTVGKGDVDIVKSVTSSGGSVNMKVQDGNVHVGNNGPDVDTVTAKKDVTLETADGKITVDGKTSTQTGDITLKAANKSYEAGTSGQNIIINNGTDNNGIDHNGKVVAYKNATLISVNSDLHVTDDVIAQNGNLNAITQKQGDISLDKEVTVNKDILMQADIGNITVGKNLESKEGSINVKTKEGNIRIGDNGPTAKTVTAKENVSLVTEEGKIEVFGKTSTYNGDVTLKAANKEYVAGADGQNIIIDHQGQIDSGHDVTLVAKNGDLHVTDRVSARHSMNAITQSKGDVFLDRDVDVNGSVTMKTDTGNIYADRDVKAVSHIEAATGEGDIRIDTATAKSVFITSGGANGYATVNAVHAQAGGNANGTGAEDVKLGGSHVTVGTIVNDSNNNTPLTISTLGGYEDKPMKDINIGVRVADGVYTGGIQSASGAVVQDLWTERGMLYMKGDTNLHVSKVVVKEKLHVANDIISVGVFGVPPYHDGARMIYWNDAEAKNPSGRLARWYDRSYSDPEWMYLDLFGNGDVGSRYGVLMDAHWYRNIYGDSVSMVDTMRIRTAPIPMGDTITYFNRNHLIEIDDIGLYSDADPDEITAE